MKTHHNGFFSQFAPEEIVRRLAETPADMDGFFADVFLLQYADFFAYRLLYGCTECRRVEGLLDRGGKIKHYYAVEQARRGKKVVPVFMDARGKTDNFNEFVAPFYPLRATDYAKYCDETSAVVDSVALGASLSDKYPDDKWQALVSAFDGFVSRYGFWKLPKEAVPFSEYIVR